MELTKQSQNPAFERLALFFNDTRRDVLGRFRILSFSNDNW